MGSQEHSDKISVTVEFSGGLEMLFDDKTKHKVSLPSKTEDLKPANVGFLIKYICDHLMKDPRKELFIVDDAIRPGVLVLINDADWELEGEEKCELSSGDNVFFVSTLHGG